MRCRTRRWTTGPRRQSTRCRRLAISGYPCPRARENLHGSHRGADPGLCDPPTGRRRSDAARRQGTSGLTASLAMTDVPRILSAIEQGDTKAAEQLLPLVYDELRKLAARRLA